MQKNHQKKKESSRVQENECNNDNAKNTTMITKINYLKYRLQYNGHYIGSTRGIHYFKDQRATLGQKSFFLTQNPRRIILRF